VAINAQCGRRLGEMKIEFLLAAFAGLVRDVAGFAAHVERRVAAALFRDVQPDGVAGEANIPRFPF